MSVREVPVTNLVANMLTDSTAFANDFIDAIDAKVKMNPALEDLTDALKPILKSAAADVLEDQRMKLEAITITCED